MQSNFLKLLFLLLTISFMSSCLDTTTTTSTPSTNPSFVSMTLAGNDTVKKAVFTLDATGTTIINIDSLPFRARIDSLNPTFTFKSTSGAFLHLTLDQGFKFTKGKKDSVAVSGKDTVDFRQTQLKISNFAADKKAYVKYYVQVNVHKVQPELYVWNQIENTNLNSATAKYQKAVIFNDKFYYYKSDDTKASLFSSNDGYAWLPNNSLNGFPAGKPLSDMLVFNGKIFLSRDGFNLYSSVNGVDWIKSTVSDFRFSSLISVKNGKLWAVVQSVADSKYHFATTTDGTVWSMIGTIPDSFPVSDFAAITLTTVTNLQKFLVIGGYSSTGSLLKNFWSSEDGLNWFDFSNPNINTNSYNNFSNLAAGASLISYDNKLLIFGKTTSDDNFYLQSTDEGLSWQTTNYYNQIAIGIGSKSSKTYKDTVIYNNWFVPHSYQSVVVDKNNRIFTIGGQSVTNISTDVWTGMLNRKKFIRQ